MSTGRFCCQLALSFALIAAEAPGQILGDASLDAQWRAVEALTSGELVKVRLLKTGIVSGTMVSCTETALTLNEKGRQMNIGRSDIRELKVKGRQRSRK